MSEVVVFRPDLQKCIQSYTEMVDSFSHLPEDMLVSGALDYAKRIPGAKDSPWLQALSLKNEDLAIAVREMIDNDVLPENAGS